MIAGAIALLLGSYLTFWPAPITPVVWHAPPAPGYTGTHAANRGLTTLQKIPLHNEFGPEHITIGPDNHLYLSVLSGRILRLSPDGAEQQVYAQTNGRPLGTAFDASHNLIVADAYKGLLSIAKDGTVTVLANEVQPNDPIRFADAVTIARDGTIYFTDASQRFVPKDHGGTNNAAILDVLEQSATGRVLAYSPATKQVRVVANGLSFANGIALSSDEQTLFVNESGRYRVWKIATTANAIDVQQPSPQAQILFDNLPGYPDNLMRGLDGKIWLGFAGQRDGLDAMAQYPALRKVVWRVPQALWIRPKNIGHVMAFTEDGTIVADLQDPTGNSPATTGATETADRLYIHNVDGNELGWLQK
ncbi:SMP-30/gluconolactonase/LRE family protein [Pseudoduganella ginsengisoli]|uniref:SMP-30/gluconolactonase/LRE family protein n=2 Tax=Pseudoduganella ginsengisoli TaxID=1462440 RepID=A0A6L6Q7Z3_9BURK|nr:SMP-30/gluconolactonase/LRE family protein [Pseudoduganella ginsengisoli]